jgi:hypothetical protein
VVRLNTTRHALGQIEGIKIRKAQKGEEEIMKTIIATIYSEKMSKVIASKLENASVTRMKVERTACFPTQWVDNPIKNAKRWEIKCEVAAYRWAIVVPYEEPKEYGFGTEGVWPCSYTNQKTMEYIKKKYSECFEKGAKYEEDWVILDPEKREYVKKYGTGEMYLY